MIIVTADTGTYKFDAKPEDVSGSGTTLRIKRDNQIIAQFRSWQNWHESQDQTE